MQKRKRPEFHDRGAVWSNFRTTGVDGSDIEWADDNPLNAPSSRGYAPVDAQHDRKRRHVEYEMSNMSLGETNPSMVRDEEMTSGSSYDISPNRVYVNSLEDSSDEEDGGPQDMSFWEVNPLVARRLESKARAQQAEKGPPWIKPSQPNEQESPTPNSLVLWQPPPWAAEPAQAVDRTQESDMMAIEP